MNIRTNVAALAAQTHLTKSHRSLLESFNRLSSGLRVNSAADDAAGLAISEGMRAKIRSYVINERNANDGISMAQSAEGALGEMHGVLGRMRELAVQAANGSLSSTERGYVNEEFSALKNELVRIQRSAQFNGIALLATSSSSLQFQVGLENTSSDQITLTFGGLSLSSLVAASTQLSGTAGNALASLSRIDSAVQSVSSSRAQFGAAMNRLEVAAANIRTMRLNLTAAESRIRDADVAHEAAQLSRSQVLAQAGTSVLGQANQLPQMALNLLQG